MHGAHRANRFGGKRRNDRIRNLLDQRIAVAGLADYGVSADLHVLQRHFGGAQPVHGRIAASRYALRLGVHQKQPDSVLGPLLARDARRDDELVGDVAVNGETFLAIEHITSPIFLRRRRHVGEIVARLPLDVCERH